MKLTTTLTALFATLALASTAGAETRHLEGGFRADPDATISMDVVLRHGRPVEARHLRLSGLDYVCESSGATGEMDADLGDASIFRSARGGFEFETEPSVPGLGGVVAGGLLRRDAAKVKGGVVYFFEDSAGDACQSIFDGRYVVR
jgi:hypothetical protein